MTVLYTAQLVPASYMVDSPPKLQLYVNTGGAMGSAVGSAISGVVDGTYNSRWTFDVTSVALGTYFAQIEDVSNPNAPAFPARKTSGLFFEISASASPTPSAIDGICNVLFSVVDNSADPVAKASVYAMLEPNSTASGTLIASTINRGQTAADGTCTLSLIQIGEFTAGGQYLLRVTDRAGKLIWKKRCEIPNQTSVNAEELVAI
jgi:hypothetical protein